MPAPAQAWWDIRPRAPAPAPVVNSHRGPTILNSVSPQMPQQASYSPEHTAHTAIGGGMMAPLRPFDRLTTSLPVAPPMPPPAQSDLPKLAAHSARAMQASSSPPMAETVSPTSPRRRAAAAASAGMAASTDMFADPQTKRFSYEHIATSRDALNPVCKELYLTDEDFKRILGIEKVAFYSMPLWKQRELKKRVGLF
jgi:hypothetical protein